MKCSKCGTEMTALDSFRCPSCGKMLCLSHRMPDRHDCYADDVLKGIEVKSLMTQKAEPKSEPKQPDTRNFQREPLSSEPAKRKRFGLF